ncbi:uncharacterized protein LOC142792528 [Rhipicephalus microplus]|uniref:uncharacterized protein LOC142792528 n=1 Tax=Rhipicephalus microplus TaxID=6941 RepID=UPI003F6B9988
MDPNWRPTLFDVDSYPILRDIARWSESAPSGQSAFFDSNWARQNIDHDAGGLSSQNHWLSVFPVQGQDQRTCDYIQLAGVSGQFQHQQQQQMQERDQQPASHYTESSFTSQVETNPRDIPHVSERVSSEQVPFVDTSWHSQSIDRETEGLSPQGHALSQFPQPGQWGHRTYDNVQQVGLSGRLRTEQVGYYPLWQYGNPGFEGLARPETIPSERAEHQDHSNHHNEVSPHQLMPYALFQQQQQQMQDREQQPAPHDTESEFTSQVESYPPQREISGVTESVTSEEVSFVDIDGPPENIDEETGVSGQNTKFFRPWE